MLEEFKFFYRNLTLYKRLLICSLAGMLVPLYVYFDGVDEVESRYEAAVTENAKASKQLEEAKIKASELPTLVAQLESTREKLKLVEAALPDNVKIDEVLRTVGKTVKPAEVQVLLFRPEPQILRGDVYKYVEVPVSISVEAHEYSQICEWLDSVAGESKPMYLNSWKIKPAAADTSSKSGQADPGAGSQPTGPALAEQLARASREDLKLKFEGRFSMFKLATEKDIPAEPNKDGGKPKGTPGNASKSPDAETLKKWGRSEAKPSEPIEKRRQ
jgi:Tfp pilus assembly protein PilO